MERSSGTSPAGGKSMAVATTIYAYEATFSGQTYTASNKGMHELDFEYGGTALKDWLSTPLPTFLAVVDQEVKVKIRLREVKTLPTLETKSDLVVKIKGGSSDVTITFKDMVLCAINGNQGRAGLGYVEFAFEHVNSTGSAAPIT